MKLDLTRDYDHAVATFDWQIPTRFNIAHAISDQHAVAAPARAALIFAQADGKTRTWSQGEVGGSANRLANALEALGIGRGDIVGVHLPQSPECLIAHIAILKRGAIVLPLFRLFGPDALTYRLSHSRAKCLLTLNSAWEQVRTDVDALDTLEHVITVGQASRPTRSFWQLISSASDTAQTADTSANDPAVIIYTSGTTGPPKGALHAHRVLFGHLPGVVLPHDGFPQAGDRFWTPADWAWIGGLLDVLWPALHCGVPVVGSDNQKFDPEWAFQFMTEHGVRNVFMPATALRMMAQVPNPRERFSPGLRSLASGGETLGRELIAWGRDTLGVTMNEFYGQTECNLVVGNCAKLFDVQPGSMGRAIPGHHVGIVDDDGHEVPTGEAGVVAVRRPDPVMFLEYLHQPEATAAKFRGDWFLLGDVARRDADGHFWFEGRDDDIISSSGYRIGPGEIEDCLSAHPAISHAGVVGLPDPVRGEVVAAYIVLSPGVEQSADLEVGIRDHVRARLAAHEYPRIIRFVTELPMTVTGKIKRGELRERGTRELEMRETETAGSTGTNA
ncbi:MAG: acyl-CoA synthetase [Pseudomonadota bacterium]